MRTVTTLVPAASKAAAQALAVANGDGPNTFSVPLSTSQGVTNPAMATHWGYSGMLPSNEIAAFEASTSPVLSVVGSSLNDCIALRAPQLHRIYEGA